MSVTAPQLDTVKIFVKTVVLPQMMSLYFRWQDEKEYEDFADYATVIQNFGTNTIHITNVDVWQFDAAIATIELKASERASKRFAKAMMELSDIAAEDQRSVRHARLSEMLPTIKGLIP